MGYKARVLELENLVTAKSQEIEDLKRGLATLSVASPPAPVGGSAARAAGVLARDGEA